MKMETKMKPVLDRIISSIQNDPDADIVSDIRRISKEFDLDSTESSWLKTELIKHIPSYRGE